MIVCDGGFCAQNIASEGCASTGDIVANSQVILNGHVGRQNLTRYRQLNTGSSRTKNANGRSDLHNVHVSFGAQNTINKVKVIVGIHEVGEVRQI